MPCCLQYCSPACFTSCVKRQLIFCERKAVWPGEHWKKSKQIARELERELGLKRPTSRRFKKMFSNNVYAGSSQVGKFGRNQNFGNRAFGNRWGEGKNTNRTNRPTKSSWRMSNIGHPTARQQRPSKSPHAISATGISSKYSTHDSGNRSSANAASAQRFARQHPKGTGTKSNRTFALQKFRGGASKSWQLPHSVSGASKSPHLVALPIGKFTRPTREEKKDQQPTFMPMRPSENGAMSLAQRIDLKAAQDGKISWAEYYRKWGGGEPTP